jgi:hypothetical protein
MRTDAHDKQPGCPCAWGRGDAVNFANKFIGGLPARVWAWNIPHDGWNVPPIVSRTHGRGEGSSGKPHQNSRYVYGWLSRPYAEARTLCRALDIGPAGVYVGTLTGIELARAYRFHVTQH